MYQIDPINDLALAEEFRLTPVGHHSPNLMRILNIMRYDASGYQTVLIVRLPFREWVLGVMPPDRNDPITLHPDDRVFTAREDAEWAVFCARWQSHTGHQISTPRDVSILESDQC